ncbi:50S ribosomal protein L10 [Thermodesulfobacteriota bacterium]
MNRDEKVAEVEELNGKFAKAKIAIVADYKGLTVPVLQELRHNLRRNEAEFRVAKNSLLIRAVEDTEYKGLQDQFVGTTAVTVSYDDPVTPAKILAEFSKDHPELKIRSASLDGKLLSVDEVIALSILPSKEVLLSQMLSVMNAVPTGLVQVLSGVPRTFLYALQAIKEQKEQAAN